MIRRAASCALLLACAHARTPEQQALIKGGDCVELLKAADAARAQGDRRLASDLASGCAPDKLAALADASTPAQGLLWCGRAAAARQKGCDGQRVAELAGKLAPHISIGP